MNKAYTPISCLIYDQLEAAAVLKKRCDFLVKEERGTILLKAVRVKDLYSRERVEYALLDNGKEFRLDYILEFNGLPIEGACKIHPG